MKTCLSASLLLVAGGVSLPAAVGQDPTNGLFVCSEGFCTSWTDGCNSCSGSGCTEMWCECYNDESCVPACRDNDSCVPAQGGAIQDPTNGLFDCTEGVCTAWNDGCNDCSANGECTEMDCGCDQEGSNCIPACNDNPTCVPAGSAVQDPTNGLFDCAEGVCTSWTDGCNGCSADGCTEMACACYQDDSCIPECNDNPTCVLAGSALPVSNVIEECTPTGEESCPVARCASPPAGCTYIFDHYTMGADGQCCASLCYSVDENGVACSFDGGEPSAPVDSLPAVAEDSECTPTGEESCAVAQCAGPPDGCKYVFNHFVASEVDGACCPKLCYAVDENGVQCMREGDDNNSAFRETIGKTCDPNEPVATATARQATQERPPCPVADCALVPEGCEYSFGHFVVNLDGNCCERQCYALDAEGNECEVDGVSTVPSSARNNGFWLAVTGIAAALL